MTAKTSRSRLPSIKCPHCRAKTIVRDSQQVTDQVRELRIVCSDDDCGFSAVAQLSFIREIRPSTRPNPDVRLPFGQWSTPKPANVNHPDPANDDAADRRALLGTALASAMST